MTERAESSLYVAWRHPGGLIHPVGLLTQRVSNGSETYHFVYLKSAESLEGFRRLPGLPDLYRVYESTSLFPVFLNRQMPRRRPDYGEYVSKLGLDVDADPFQVMARDEGRKLTDRIEVFAPPTRTEDGNLTTLFFVRGIRLREGSSQAVEAIRPGDYLAMADDHDNEVNPRAIFIDTSQGKPVGWVPNYLVNTVHELCDRTGGDAAITAEHVNPPDAAPSMRLICRLTTRWPDTYQPFSGQAFEPTAA